MKILYLSYERGIELAERGHSIMYGDAAKIGDAAVEPVYDELQRIKTFEPDLIIEREFNDGKANFNLFYKWAKQTLPHTKRVAWLIDTHISRDRHYEYAKNFDAVFLAVSRFVKEFRTIAPTYWLPLCYPYRSDSIQPNYRPPQFEVSFVGRWNPQWFPKRTALINGLRQYYGDRFYAVTDYEKMLSIVKGSRISVNHSIADDMNFRVWEVLGSGTELVTDDVPDLHKVEGLNKRLSFYLDIAQAPFLIDRLLANDPQYTHNTIENQTWVKKQHCLVHRHLAILDMLHENRQLPF